MRKTLITLAALASLSACGQNAPEDVAASDAVTAPDPREAAVSVEQHERTHSESNETAAGEIPERFHGVWDHVKGTCSPESDMRMEISARQIRFHESIGMVAGVGAEGDQPLVDLMMSGEGDQWVESRRLSLMKDGTELHISDALKPKVVDDYPRKRCPQ